MDYAFLFDIDGCVTLPTTSEDPRSILDIKLLDCLLNLQKSYPIAFVTGRSQLFLELMFNNAFRPKFHQFKIYLEFGLVYWYNSEIKIVQLPEEFQEEFQEEKSRYIEFLHQEAEANGIFFEQNQTYVDYPNHESMWIEDKYVMLSIAGGPKVEPSIIHKLANAAYKKSNFNAKLLEHHLGIDFVPAKWSKEQAVRDFLKRTAIDESQYEWLVFGDNLSDQTMTIPLSKYSFINTKNRASIEVWDQLCKLHLSSCQNNTKCF